MNQRKVGVVLSYITMGATIVINLVLTPILIFFLGKSEYGLYQLVASIISYLAIMDFGLSNTTIRYYSGYMARNEEKKKENLLAITAILYCIITVLILIAGLVLLYFLMPVYAKTLTPQEMLTAKKLFAILLINVMVFVPSNIFTAVIKSHQKFIFEKGLILSSILLRPVVVVALLCVWPSAVVLAVVYTSFNILISIITAYYCFAKLKVKFKLHGWDKPLLKETTVFTFFVFVAVLLDQAYLRTGQIILGAIVGTSAVAVYSVAVLVYSAYAGCAFHIGGVFLPYISSIAAKTDDMTEINAIFIKIGRLQWILSLLVLSGFFLFGRQFIHYWIGPSFEGVYLCALLIMTAATPILCQGTGVFILQAKNKHAFRAGLYFVLAVLNIFLSVFFTKKWGITGCAWAMVSTLALQVVGLDIYYAKIGVAVKKFWLNIMKITLFIAPCFALGWFMEYKISSPDVFFFILRIAAYSGLYFCAIWYFALNNYEKNLIRHPAKKLIKKLYR